MAWFPTVYGVGKWALDTDIGKKVGKFVTKNAGNMVGTVINKGYLGQTVKNKFNVHGGKLAEAAVSMLGKDNVIATNISDLMTTARGDNVAYRSIEEKLPSTQTLNQSANRFAPYVSKLHTTNYQRIKHKRGKRVVPGVKRLSKFAKKF